MYADQKFGEEVMNENVFIKMLAKKFPKPMTRSFTQAVLVLFVVTSALAGYAQIHWPGWFFVGHSYSAWICVSILAAARGTIVQSWMLCSGGLTVAVIAYYASWAISEPDLAGQFNPNAV